MVSTFDNPADVERARKLGAVACLHKPPEPREAQRLTANLMHRGYEKSYGPRLPATFSDLRIRREDQRLTLRPAKRIQSYDKSQPRIKPLNRDADEKQSEKASSRHR
jgi:hypothetical protein